MCIRTKYLRSTHYNKEFIIKLTCINEITTNSSSKGLMCVFCVCNWTGIWQRSYPKQIN